jgi:hypothetical protein
VERFWGGLWVVAGVVVWGALLVVVAAVALGLAGALTVAVWRWMGVW